MGGGGGEEREKEADMGFEEGSGKRLNYSQYISHYLYKLNHHISIMSLKSSKN